MCRLLTSSEAGMSSQRVRWGMGWGGPLHTLEIPEYKTLQMHRLHMYIVPTPRFIKKIDIFATKDEQPAGEMG